MSTGITILLVRLLPHAQYGALAVGSSIAAVLGGLSAMGLAPAVAQFGRAHPQSGPDTIGDAYQTARSIARISSIVFGLTTAGLFLALYFIPSLRTVALVLIALSPAIVAAPFQNAAVGLFNALYRVRVVTVSGIIGYLAQLVLVGAVVGAGVRSAPLVALARLCAGLVGVGLVLVAARQWRRSAAHARVQAKRPMVQFGAAMVATSTVGALISQLDLIVLGLISGTVPAGRYAPVSRLADAILLLPAALATYLLPVISEAHARGEPRRVAEAYHWTSKWAIVLAAPMVGVLIASPHAVLSVLFGPGTAGVETPTRVLGLGVLVHFAFGFNGSTLDAFGQARAVAFRSALGLSTSVLSCVLLIPPLGILGAATATTISITVVNLTCSRILLRQYRLWPWNREVSLVLLALAGSLALSWVLNKAAPLPNLATVVLDAAICFVGAAFAALMSDLGSARSVLTATVRLFAPRQGAT